MMKELGYILVHMSWCLTSVWLFPPITSFTVITLIPVLWGGGNMIKPQINPSYFPDIKRNATPQIRQPTTCSLLLIWLQTSPFYLNTGLSTPVVDVYKGRRRLPPASGASIQALWEGNNGRTRWGKTCLMWWESAVKRIAKKCSRCVSPREWRERPRPVFRGASSLLARCCCPHLPN